MRCLNCGKIFKPKRSDALFCSTPHRVAYNRRIRNSVVTDKSGQIYPNYMKTILSLCDFTGEWSKPYSDAGYNVIRIDVKNGQDVRLLKHTGEVYGVLSAPPCTHFSIAGAPFWKVKGEDILLEALSIFDACARVVLFSKPKFWVFENPVGRLKEYIGSPAWIFDPCDYGDAYTKKTCLWGRFNSPKPKNQVEPMQAPTGHHSQDKWLLSQGLQLKTKERADLRSITPRGFAEAFFKANQ